MLSSRTCRMISIYGSEATIRIGHIKGAGETFLDAIPIAKEKMIAA